MFLCLLPSPSAACLYIRTFGRATVIPNKATAREFQHFSYLNRNKDFDRATLRSGLGSVDSDMDPSRSPYRASPAAVLTWVAPELLEMHFRCSVARIPDQLKQNVWSWEGRFKDLF